MPNLPNTNTPGLVLLSDGNGQNGGYWGESQGGMFTITKSLLIVGPIVNYTYPRFTMAVPAGQSDDLVAIIAVLSAGTVDVDVLQNGTGIPGLTSVAVSGTSTGYVNPTTNPTPVLDLDYFQITASSSSGTGDLTIDFVFEITP